MDTKELIAKAFESWQKENENQTVESAFFAGAHFVINYLLKRL